MPANKTSESKSQQSKSSLKKPPESESDVREVVNLEEKKSNIIDFVLVYKMSTLSEKQQLQLLLYERNLLHKGFFLRTERYSDMTFLKVTVSQSTLYQYAELLRLRMPLKLDDVFIATNESGPEDKILRFFSLLNFYKVDESYKICSEFSRDKMYLFDKDDPDYFNQADRISIAAYIIARAYFGDPENYGIQPLMIDKTFLTAYPLHDGAMDTKDSRRYNLFKNWASIRCWYKKQPLTQIRDYFGSSVALYFTWMGFYNKMLIPASLGGILTTILGMSYASYDGYTNEICNKNITMCPLCDKYCPYWNLKTQCSFAKVSQVSDNMFTIVFSVLMSLWNIMYVVLWKRHMIAVTYNWGLCNYHITEEPTRPEYIYKLRNVKRRRLNVLTLNPEPYLPFWKNRLPIFIFSGSVVILWVVLAISMYLCVVFYEMYIHQFRNEKHLNMGQFLFTVTIACANLSLIYIMYFLYRKCALWLTNIELHRTASQHEDSFFFKLYVFQFVTHYTPVFYLAFAKHVLVGYPDNYTRIFGVRARECIGSSCLFEVMVYIAITMTAKQAFYVITARYLPVIMIYKLQIRAIYNNIFKGKEPRHYNQMVDDYKLLAFTPRALYVAYLDMVLQFGFISMFVNAFPLSHAFALFYNTIRIRVDAIRLLRYHKRPVPRIVKGIGVWLKIILFITRCSVFTNAFMIATSPRFIPLVVFSLEGISDRFGYGCLMHTLSKFDTKDFKVGTAPLPKVKSNADYCYYFGYKEPPESRYKYAFSTLYWKVLAGRLGFIIAYYVFANMLMTFVQWVVPETPTNIREKLHMEYYHVSRAIIKKEKKNN